MFFARLAAAVEDAAEERSFGVVLCVTANQIERNSTFSSD